MEWGKAAFPIPGRTRRIRIWLWVLLHFWFELQWGNVSFVQVKKLSCLYAPPCIFGWIFDFVPELLPCSIYENGNGLKETCLIFGFPIDVFIRIPLLLYKVTSFVSGSMLRAVQRRRFPHCQLSAAVEQPYPHVGMMHFQHGWSKPVQHIVLGCLYRVNSADEGNVSCQHCKAWQGCISEKMDIQYSYFAPLGKKTKVHVLQCLLGATCAVVAVTWNIGTTLPREGQRGKR